MANKNLKEKSEEDANSKDSKKKSDSKDSKKESNSKDPKKESNSKDPKKESNSKKDAASENLESKSDSKEEKNSEEEVDEESDELAKLNKDLKEKDEEIAELKSFIQRQQADFENYRKVSDRQTKNIIEHANEDLILKFLDVYEDMGRVLENAKTEEDLKEGLDLINSKMKDNLSKEGVEEIPTVGEKFDVNRHEALTTMDSPDFENNQIMAEVMKGYTLKDKVIKYPKVVVCKKKK